MPKNQPKDPGRKKPNQALAAMAIPSLLLAGPIGGILMSIAIIRMFGFEGRTANLVRAVCMLAFVAGGAYESAKVIRKISGRM